MCQISTFLWRLQCNAQVEFQLGTSPRDTLQCAWGAELANKDDPTSGMVVKLELTDAAKAFVQRFESATIAAANANSQGWFGRPTPTVPTRTTPSSRSRAAPFPTERRAPT